MSNEKWKEDHTEIRDFRPAKCPCMNIGCENCPSVNMDMSNHMPMDMTYHSRFLIEFIDNLRKEIKTMKEDKIVLEKNVGDLKKCIKYLQLKYENNDEEIKRKLKEIEDKSNEEQKRNNDSRLKCESDNKEMRQKLKQIENKLVEEDKNVIELRREMKRMNDEKESMKENVAENKKSINDSKLKCVRESREIKEKIKEIENKSDKQEREMMIKIDDINEKMVDLKSISKESDKIISVLQNKIKILKKKQEQQPFGELIWYVENWHEFTEQTRASVNKEIYSDVFYSHINGYKMCLSLWLDGMISCKGPHLSIACNVVPGENDKTLTWPFKHDVTFELINQRTNQVHKSCTLSYNWNTFYIGEVDLFNPPHANSSGTLIEFISTNGVDTAYIDNQTITVSTSLNCISAMEEYQSKSFEELRHEDYLVNRLHPQQSYNKYNKKVEIKECKNWICQNRKFISLEELSNNNSLIYNDQILIRCRVT